MQNRRYRIKLNVKLPTIRVKAYGHGEDLKKAKPLRIANEGQYISYLKRIARQYPFLAIAGLRIFTELKIK